MATRGKPKLRERPARAVGLPWSTARHSRGRRLQKQAAFAAMTRAGDRTAAARPMKGVRNSSTRSGSRSRIRSPSPASSFCTISATAPPISDCCTAGDGLCASVPAGEPIGELGKRAVEGAPVMGGHLAARARRGREREAGELRVGREDLEGGGDLGGDLGRPSFLPGGCLAGGIAEVVRDLVEGREEALFLRVEVAVEGAPRDAGRRRDLGDGRLVVAELGDGGDDPGREAVALVLGDEIARQAMAAGGKARKPRRLGGARSPRRTIPGCRGEWSDDEVRHLGQQLRDDQRLTGRQPLVQRPGQPRDRGVLEAGRRALAGRLAGAALAQARGEPGDGLRIARLARPGPAVGASTIATRARSGSAAASSRSALSASTTRSSQRPSPATAAATRSSASATIRS